jgi:hypothetical protein
LPVPELAELQRRARGSDDVQQRDLALSLAERLRGLAPEQREALGGATQPSREEYKRGDRADENQSEQEPEILLELEAALTELVARVRLDFTPGERFRAALLREGVRQLATIEAQIASEGLTVPGSRGQRRPHPLLSQSTTLLRDLDNRYRRFELDVKLRAQFDRAQASFFQSRRRRRDRAEAGTTRPPLRGKPIHASARTATTDASLSMTGLQLLQVLGLATAVDFGGDSRQARAGAEDADDLSGESRPR